MTQAHAATHASHESADKSGFGSASNGKIAMWIFLVTDGLTFAGLLLGYGYLRIKNPNWPNPTVHLGIVLTAVATFILICSSLTMVLSLAEAEEKNKSGMLRFLALTALGGISFLGIQAYEYTHLHHEGFSLSRFVDPEHPTVPFNFASTFFVITGFHGLHVFTGVTYLLTMLVKVAQNQQIYATYMNLLEIAGLFWHFFDLVWILVFTFIYLI